MPSPFYLGIKGTTAGTPGTGAFTPNAAASSGRAWSGNVPAGWIGLVRYDDGSAWELSWSYWDGTSLSRAATQFLYSSTGSQLSLTSAATASMITDPNEVMSHLGGVPTMLWSATENSTTFTNFGITVPTVITVGTRGLANTSLLAGQRRASSTSPTTANGQSSVSSGQSWVLYSTVAGQGGFEMVSRWGPVTLPTGPRLLVGLTVNTFVGNTGEPSAQVTSAAAFIKDSTDTNIQFYTNDNSGGGNKTDTGIPLVAGGWYETSIWADPGGGKVKGLICRLDTGALWYGETTSQLPVNGALMIPQHILGLSATTGTAAVLDFGHMCLRQGI